MRKVDAMREPDYEAARGGSTLIEFTMQPRGDGITLKRLTSSGKGTAGNWQCNGDHIEHTDTGREPIQLGYRSKSAQFRSFKGDKIDCTWRKSSLELYKIAIIAVATCFLAVSLMQGSMVLIVKHTDFLTFPGDDDHESHGHSLILLEADGISNCERAVKFAMQNFTEHLELRASLQEMWKLERTSRRPPRLALICPNLEEVPSTLYLITVARGLQRLGYRLELYARQDGQLRSVWEDSGIPVHFVEEDWRNITVDWLLFEGIIAISLEAKKTLESLAQEPFVDIPVVWIIQEKVILHQDTAWNVSAELQTVYRSWLDTFNRSSVLVFPNYFLPIVYNDFYTGRFYVIDGSPGDVWEAKQYIKTHTREGVRANAGLTSEDYVIVVVSSPCTKREIWREHAIVMKAVANLISSSSSQQGGMLGNVTLLILGYGNSSSVYEDALQIIAENVGLKDGLVKHVGVDKDVHEVLWMADAVVYASIWEELSFPAIVIRAMSLERPIIVPDLDVISQQITNGHSGFLFPAGDDQALGQVLSMVRSNPVTAGRVAVEGASIARDLLARDTVVEYGYLLEKLLSFPDETQLPRPAAEIHELIPPGWRWDLVGEYTSVVHKPTVKDLQYLQSATDLRFVGNESDVEDPEIDSLDSFDILSETDLTQEEKSLATERSEQFEDELIRDRLERVHTSFEDVSKMVKKTETRVSQEKHLEVDHLEVERVAQPICIYEPYHGSGAWSFLHRNQLLYQGLSLSAEGRRPYLDDVDGAGRLRLLNNSYYRAILCDFAGFFAVAILIDRLHWNSWIGFQPWRAISRKVALTPQAETALLTAVSEEKDGDALYFWAQMGSKDSETADDFWSSCDSASAGNCRTVFLDTFRQMYSLPSTWMQVPPMPAHGGIWSAMHCWAMPTTSFLEFVMFARMFVDALDTLQYEDHHERGRCCFSRVEIEVKHCYCKFLEGLVNIWAYHSARRMIFVDPESGFMVEQHTLERRKGTLWVKWFRQSLLKSMDEDLAEEAEDDSSRRWLWPETGEVFWAGSKEKERRQRYMAKVEKKRHQLERQAQQSKYRQRAIGRYVKPKAVKQQSP